MTSGEKPYISSCSFCQNGLLRFYRCGTCHAVVVLCDECELMWEDVKQVSDDPNQSSDSCYPRCPACGDPTAAWSTASSDEIEDHGLRQYKRGESI